MAEKAFDTCLANGWQAKVTTITAKEKICLMDEVKCDPSYCSYAKGYFDRINEATKDLFESEQLFNRDRIVSYAKKHSVCPFEYSLAMASISDAVIGDYNYMFDPRAYLRRFFDEPFFSNNTALSTDSLINQGSRRTKFCSRRLVRSKLCWSNINSSLIC